MESVIKNKIFLTPLLFLLCAPGVVFARDPFASLASANKAHIMQMQPTLMWLSLQYADATEIVDWVHHQKGLLNKNTQVGADIQGRKIWIKASGSERKQLVDMIKRMDKPKRQIMVAARFVRINSEHEDKLGVRWGDLHYHLGTADCGLALDAQIDALVRHGQGKIIAAPKLLLTDGQEASIESGQKIPYQEKVNHNSTATHFEKAVLGLKVIAHSLPDNRIALDLTIHQDKPLGFSNQLAPSINTQVVKTHVLVQSGHIIVLGGIFEDVYDTAEQKVPLLGDIPVLGAMFRHKAKHCERTELLVYIQPTLM